MSEPKMQLPCILVSGAPTAATVGWVGLFAMDTASSSGDLYKCTAASNGVYTWRKIESGGGSTGGGTGGGVSFTPGNALELTEDGILNVRTTNDAEEDNTLPITSAGVNAIVGNIGALLDTI